MGMEVNTKGIKLYDLIYEQPITWREGGLTNCRLKHFWTFGLQHSVEIFQKVKVRKFYKIYTNKPECFSEKLGLGLRTGDFDWGLRFEIPFGDYDCGLQLSCLHH